ncbi:MAG TPA: hypothetical protein VF001_06250 [Candidatus Limnocylindria bacterium]
MRLLFESVRMPVVASFPRDAGTPLDGSTVAGAAWLTVRMFDAEEAIPKQHDHARSLAQWLEQLGDRQPGSTLPEAFRSESGVREVVVPTHVFERLPRDTLIAVDWEFEAAVA